jgi:hypothetical protein
MKDVIAVAGANAKCYRVEQAKLAGKSRLRVDHRKRAARQAPKRLVFITNT